MVYFGEKNSADWNLKLYDFQAPPPQPQTAYVDIPFRDGALDFSTAMTNGVVRYKNRVLTLGFDLCGSWTQWVKAISEMNHALHGQKLRIRTELDPDYYYLGRCTVSYTKESFAIGSVVVSADCDPYKYKLSPTVKEFDVNGELAVTLSNERMPTVPMVTTDAEITVHFGESTLVFPAGSRRAPALLLLEGENQLNLTGSGHIRFEYQEGAL